MQSIKNKRPYANIRTWAYDLQTGELVLVDKDTETANKCVFFAMNRVNAQKKVNQLVANFNKFR